MYNKHIGCKTHWMKNALEKKTYWIKTHWKKNILNEKHIELNTLD